MSAINGDKSRFNRQRKQKIARRIRNRKLLQTMTEQRKSTSGAPESKSEATPA